MKYWIRNFLLAIAVVLCGIWAWGPAGCSNVADDSNTPSVEQSSPNVVLEEEPFSAALEEPQLEAVEDVSIQESSQQLDSQVERESSASMSFVPQDPHPRIPRSPTSVTEWQDYFADTSLDTILYEFELSSETHRPLFRNSASALTQYLRIFPPSPEDFTPEWYASLPEERQQRVFFALLHVETPEIQRVFTSIMMSPKWPANVRRRAVVMLGYFQQPSTETENTLWQLYDERDLPQHGSLAHPAVLTLSRINHMRLEMQDLATGEVDAMTLRLEQELEQATDDDWRETLLYALYNNAHPHSVPRLELFLASDNEKLANIASEAIERIRSLENHLSEGEL